MDADIINSLTLISKIVAASIGAWVLLAKWVLN
jgi:hypothetical protein